VNIVIASSPERLPQSIRDLIDETRPLPPEASFFEEKFTVSGTVYMFSIGIVLVTIGAILCLIGVFDVFHTKFLVPLLTGVVFLFGGYLLVSSVKGRMKQRREQRNGVVTRYGIFLLPRRCPSLCDARPALMKPFRRRGARRERATIMVGGDLELLMLDHMSDIGEREADHAPG
jgi:hypothetical protein